MNQRRYDDKRIDTLIALTKFGCGILVPLLVTFGIWLNVNIVDIKTNLAVLTEKEKNEIQAIQRRLDNLESRKIAMARD